MDRLGQEAFSNYQSSLFYNMYVIHKFVKTFIYKIFRVVIFQKKNFLLGKVKHLPTQVNLEASISECINSTTLIGRW